MFKTKKEPVSRPHWDGTYRRVKEAHGSHAEPEFDEDWPEIDKLRWHMAGALFGTGIEIEVGEAAYWRNDVPQKGYYSFSYPGGSSCCYNFHGAWDKIGGIELGLRLAGLKSDPFD